MMKGTSAEQIMAGLEEITMAIAAFTGIKAQFVEAGWDERVAEFMVLEMLRQQPERR
jgi:hypothetical protein